MIVTATLAIAVCALVAGSIALGGGDDDYVPLQPWEGENGIIDESKLPPTEGVVDRTGASVGVTKLADELADIYPLPVYGPDGEIVGHLGENGYWALGEEEPIIEDSVTTVMGADGPISYLRQHNVSGELIFVDRAGVEIGVVKTDELYSNDIYPAPVYGPDGEVLGHLGENGYEALGEEEAP